MTATVTALCACGAPARGQGLCRSCLARAVWSARPAKTEPCTYRAAHKRVRTLRGRAAEYVCPCGAPARHWAYTHDAGDREQHGEVVVAGIPRPAVWSPDPTHYRAMCIVCHRAYDAEHSARLVEATP